MNDPLDFLAADPALQLLYLQLAVLDHSPPMQGVIEGTSKTWEEAKQDLRKMIIEEIAEYQQRKLRYYESIS